MRKNRMPLIKAAITAACILLTVLLTRRSHVRMGTDETYFMYAVCDGIRINIFESEGEYYLFLPSFADEEKLEYSHEAKEHEIKVLRSENLPGVFITTNSGSIDNILADKEYKEAGRITVVEPDGKRDVQAGLEYLKGRGNYSWNNWDKKSFKMKLSKPGSVLGLGLGQDYCLIANASDPTLIRNDLARNLEVAVRIPYADTGRFTDLYINGNYMGNYYLCHSIEIGPDRIDITDMDILQSQVLKKVNTEALSIYETPQLKGWVIPETLDDYTGGYLVEREFGDRYDLEYGQFKNGFVTERGEHYIVISPQYCSVREICYIADCFEKAEGEIFGGGALSEYVDAESFARRYLVEEVIKNYDGGVSSTYYYKDSDSVDGRIHAGPGWDFDMSLGNYLDWMEYASEDATGITGLYLSEHSSTYFRELIQNRDFMELVRSSFYTDAVPYFEDVLANGIYDLEEELAASSLMDSIRWKSMYLEKGYSTNDHTEYEDLKRFIEERLLFLEEEWSD